MALQPRDRQLILTSSMVLSCIALSNIGGQGGRYLGSSKTDLPPDISAMVAKHRLAATRSDLAAQPRLKLQAVLDGTIVENRLLEWMPRGA